MLTDEVRSVASEGEGSHMRRLQLSINLSNHPGQDNSRQLLELLKNIDLSEIWQYIAKADDRMTIMNLPVCHIVVKYEAKQRKKECNCTVFCSCLKRLGMQIRRCICCKSKCFKNSEAQRLDNYSRRWLEILSNPLYIGVEWLWRSHHSSSTSEKPNRNQQSQSQEMMECQDEDVIKAALHNAYILQELAKYEHHYSRKEYKELASRCEQFAADLIEECDQDEESCGAAARAVDNELHEIMDIEGKGPLLSRSCNDENHLGISKPVLYDQSLSLLKYAADKGRKTFVSSPKCQSVLNEIIYYNPSWQDKNTFIKMCWFLFCSIMASVSIAVYLPYLVIKEINCNGGYCDEDGCCCYCVLGLVKQLFEHPYSRFASHTTYYIAFLLVLYFASHETDYGSTSIGFTNIDVVVLVFVIGVCSKQILKMCRQGTCFFFSKWWNVVGAFAVLFFVSAYIIWFSASAHYGGWKPRKGSFVIADVVFGSATILTYFHFTYVFLVSSVLGPLQMSLYKMLKDVLKFLLIFLLLLIAFTNGVAKVYTYYVASQIHLRRQNDTQFDPVHPFSMHVNTFIDLFWLLFSTGDEDKISVPDPDFHLTEWFGRIFLILYMICTVVVALNMLISMMNNSFERITGPDRADREWKFSRARMWLEWIDKDNGFPPPLNILYDFPYILLTLVRVIMRCCSKCSACCKEKMRIRKNRQNRMEIMKALVERYLKKHGKNVKEFEKRLNRNQERDAQDKTTHEESVGPSGEKGESKQLKLQASPSIEESLSSLKESMEKRMAELRDVMADLERKIEVMLASETRVNMGFDSE